VVLRVVSTPYDGLCPAALFSELGSQLKAFVLVLAPDVVEQMRGRSLFALIRTVEGSSCIWKASMKYVLASLPVIGVLIVVFVQGLTSGRAATAV
jgi:hypothetical protein